MKQRILTILKFFLALELAVFVVVYVKGSHGLCARWQHEQENKELADRIAVAKINLAQLEKEHEDWGHTTFPKEQIARVQLQMAAADEMVYYVID